MKKIMLTLLFVTLLSAVKCQNFYQNNLIEIKGFVNNVDSNLVVIIKNISDSVLIFSEKDMIFIKDGEKFILDLSLRPYGVSLIPPSSGEFMNFRRLFPKSNYSIVIENGIEKWEDIFSFDLLTRIQYVVVPKNVVFIDGILNREFISLVKKKNYSLYTFEESLKIINSKNNNCIQYLQIKEQ